VKSDPEEESPSSDEIGPADGRERYWMFVNGEQIRFFAALVCAFVAVVSCFLYVLGIGESFVRTALLAIIGGSFLVWRVFDLELRNYQRNNWKKDRRSPRLRKVESRVAIGLWLFIFIVTGGIMFVKWHLAR
jgi:fatty acid desaturase